MPRGPAASNYTREKRSIPSFFHTPIPRPPPPTCLSSHTSAPIFSLTRSWTLPYPPRKGSSATPSGISVNSWDLKEPFYDCRPFPTSTASLTTLANSPRLFFPALIHAFRTLSAEFCPLTTPSPCWTILSNSGSETAFSPVMIEIVLSSRGSSNAVGSASTCVLLRP